MSEIGMLEGDVGIWARLAAAHLSETETGIIGSSEKMTSCPYDMMVIFQFLEDARRCGRTSPSPPCRAWFLPARGLLVTAAGTVANQVFVSLLTRRAF
ncbi:MAG: hypothetical protein ACE15C_18865 [Phycisphaerae bacterium]